MAKLLYIESSPRKDRSASIAVARHFIDLYKARNPGDTVETLDLWAANLPPFDGHTLGPLPSPDRGGIDNGNFSTVAWSADGETLYAGGGYQGADGHPVVAWADAGAPEGTTPLTAQVPPQNDGWSHPSGRPPDVVIEMAQPFTVPAEGERRRRFYRLTPEGRRMLRRERAVSNKLCELARVQSNEGAARRRNLHEPHERTWSQAAFTFGLTCDRLIRCASNFVKLICISGCSARSCKNVD